MYTFKTKKLLVLFSSCSLLLTACFPSGGQALSTEDNSVISSQIMDIVSGNEHLEIEAELSGNVEAVPKINVKIMEWDENKLKKIFLTGKTNLEYEEHPSNSFPNDSVHVYTEEDQYWLGYEPGDLLSADRQNSFGYGRMQSVLSIRNFNDLFTDDSIKLLSKNDAINKCTLLLTEVGITNYDEPKVYAITADKANRYWEKEDWDDEYDDWTVEDEVYFLRFPIEYNNIPVTVDSKFGGSKFENNRNIPSTLIDFIVTKDKIYSINCQGIYSPEYEIIENVKINCSKENALKIAAQHYDSIDLGDQTIKILNCELVYVRDEIKEDKQYTLVPMWKVNAASYDNEDLMGSLDILFIDVGTGNIVF